MLELGFVKNIKKFLRSKDNTKNTQWYEEPFVFEPKGRIFSPANELMYYMCDRGMRSGSMTCFGEKDNVSHINSLFFSEKTKDIVVFSMERISSNQYFVLTHHMPDLEYEWKNSARYKFDNGNLKIWLGKNPAKKHKLVEGEETANNEEFGLLPNVGSSFRSIAPVSVHVSNKIYGE